MRLLRQSATLRGMANWAWTARELSLSATVLGLPHGLSSSPPTGSGKTSDALHCAQRINDAGFITIETRLSIARGVNQIQVSKRRG